MIDRLVNRHKHLLAWRICEFLKIKGDKVLVHWSCSKVTPLLYLLSLLSFAPSLSFSYVSSSKYRATNILTKTFVESEDRSLYTTPAVIHYISLFSSLPLFLPIFSLFISCILFNLGCRSRRKRSTTKSANRSLRS